MEFKQPVVAYTANGNLEAHSVVEWLLANNIAAHAVEDNSGLSVYVFGTLSQIHKPRVYVDKPDFDRARELLSEFEERRSQRRKTQSDAPFIPSKCEECGETSEFPATQDGSVQNCPKCHAFMDVGALDWPYDDDFGSCEEE